MEFMTKPLGYLIVDVAMQEKEIQSCKDRVRVSNMGCKKHKHRKVQHSEKQINCILAI